MFIYIYLNYCYEFNVRVEEYCIKGYINVNKWNFIDIVIKSLIYVINKLY